MTPITGLGSWIWNAHQCEGGDAGAISAKAATCGIDWLAWRSGESDFDGTVTAERIATVRASGRRFVAWWYSLPSTTDRQIEQAKRLVGMGVDALIIDAELEWESDKQPDGSLRLHDYRHQAFDFVHKLRAAVGADVYLGDAPWPKPRSHSLWPFAEFGSVLNGRHPQAYFGDSGEPFAKYAPEWELQWASLPHDPPVCPIGCTISGDWKHRAPVAELGAFLDRYAARQALSLWAWPSTSPEEWALLAARAAAAAPVAVVPLQPLGPDAVIPGENA